MRSGLVPSVRPVVRTHHVMTRLLGQLGIQLGRVFVDLGHAVAGAQLTDHAGRMPSGAAAEQALLQQHNILQPALAKW